MYHYLNITGKFNVFIFLLKFPIPFVPWLGGVDFNHISTSLILLGLIGQTCKFK